MPELQIIKGTWLSEKGLAAIPEKQAVLRCQVVYLKFLSLLKMLIWDSPLASVRIL